MTRARSAPSTGAIHPGEHRRSGGRCTRPRGRRPRGAGRLRRNGWLEDAAAPARAVARDPDAARAERGRGPRRAALRAGGTSSWHRQGLHRDDERRYALGVLNTALGGGTSSRLFPGGARGPAAWPTRSTPSPRVRRRRCWWASPSAACPSAPTRSCGSCASSCRSSPPRQSPPTSSPARQGAADRRHDPRARGQRLAHDAPGQERARPPRGRRHRRRHRPHRGRPVEQVRDVAADVFTRPEILAVVGPAGADSPAGR